MTAQQQAATQAMIDWLEKDRGLGKRPSRIECAGQFTLNDMQYYLFRFKKSLLGKWLLGVCGGYSNISGTEHCGHVISEMQPYEPATAEQQAIAMVDKLDANSSNESSGLFTGFVLLNSHECDLERLEEILVQDWKISCSPEESGYTCGLKQLGKDEIEIIASRVSPAELREFLMDIASYVVEYDVVLRDGETIGFTAEQKLPITRSAGVYVTGESLKIEY